MSLQEPFANLARIRILLLPVGHVDHDTFHKWARCLKSIDRIPLCDIPEDREGRSRFTPTQLAAGHLLLTHEVWPPRERLNRISLARISKWPMGILGIAQATSSDQLATLGAEFKAQLEEILLPDGLVPLARNCLAFQGEASRFTLNTKDAFSGLVVIPHDMGNKELYLSTLTAELCSAILAGFSNIASVLETEQGNKVLNAALFPLSMDLSAALEDRDITPIEADMSLTRTFSPAGVRASIVSSHSPNPDPVVSRPSSERKSSTKLMSPKGLRSSGGSNNHSVHSHSRLYRLLGDLYLMSGRFSDATIWYQQAIESLKVNGDNTWHAGALEGLCSCLILESYVDSADVPKSDVYADVWSKLAVAISLYGRLEPLNGATTEDFLSGSIMYAECVLKQAKLALAVWISEGWNSESLKILVNGLATPVHDITAATRLSNSEKSGLSCSQIAAILAQAHGPFILHLGSYDRLKVLNVQASMYAILGLFRKEAFISREILGVLMDLLECSRRTDHGDDSETSIQLITERSSMGQREVESVEGNDSIVHIIYRIAKAYDLDLAYFPIIDSHTEVHLSSPRRTVTQKTSSGWAELQLGLVREVIAIAESLPDLTTVAQFSLSTLWTSLHLLDVDDQYFLYSTALRSLATAKRRGDSRLITFWLKSPLVSISVNPSPTVLSSAPVFRNDTKCEDSGTGGPFIYDPKQSSRSRKLLLVQKETAVVTVGFYNPFSFPLELPNMTLSTTGAQLRATPTSATLPPKSIHTISLRGTPMEPGSLSIRGCYVEMPGSPVSEVLLESNPSIRDSILKARSSVIYGPHPIKHERDQDDGTQETPTIECEVAPSQPLLRIRKTSLAHGAAMIYEGEELNIRLILENVSDIPVRRLQLNFTDSIQEVAESELNSEGGISDIDVFDLFWDLKNRPVFVQSKPDEFVQRLDPGEMASIPITCFGKAGCTSGSVRVVYGCAPQEGYSSFSRLLELPILMTVWRALEIKSMNIIPYSTALLSPSTPQELILPPGGDTNEWCILVLQLKNPHTLSFEVRLERAGKDTTPADTTIIIPPGATSSALLPVKRILLSEEETIMPIPVPSDRQFVLRSPHPLGTTRSEHELFWYRERLFSCLRCGWRELNGDRSGELMIRNQRLDNEMLAVLKLEEFRTVLRMVPGPAGEQVKAHEYLCNINEFSYVKIRVSRFFADTSRHISLSLSVEPAEFVIVEGSSDRAQIQFDGDTVLWEEVRALCFIATGLFSIRTTIREGISGTILNCSKLVVTVIDLSSQKLAEA